MRKHHELYLYLFFDRCSKCENGVVLPHVSNEKNLWKCKKCGFVANSSKVASFWAKLDLEIQSLDQLAEDTQHQKQIKAAAYQGFIDKKSKLFSENSYLILNVSANLSALLGMSSYLKSLSEIRK